MPFQTSSSQERTESKGEFPNDEKWYAQEWTPHLPSPSSGVGPGDPMQGQALILGLWDQGKLPGSHRGS